MTAKSSASKKAKGKRAEKKVAEAYRRYDIDKTARPMPMSGAMTHFKGDIWKKNDYGYCDEVKNQERVQLWKFWDQTTSQASMAQVPVLHITGNHRPILTVLDMEDYMNLRKEVKDLEQIIKELQE